MKISKKGISNLESPINKIFINKSGAYINLNSLNWKNYKDDSVMKCLKKIRKHFTIKTKVINNMYVSTCQFKLITNKDEKYIRLPRFGLFSILNNKKLKKRFRIDNLLVENFINKGNNPINKFKFKGNLKDNQPIIIEHIINNIYTKEKVKNGDAGLILNLEAGQGKTFCGMYLISHIQKKTLIITHNTTIMFQWIKLLETYFPENKIGVIYGKKKEDGDIIVAVINSLLSNEIKYINNNYKKKKELFQKHFYLTKNLKKIKLKTSIIDIILEYSDDKQIIQKSKCFFNQFGFTIFDESHEYCSKQRSKIFTKCQSSYMLGLSATPNCRTDKFDPVTHWWIGPVLNAKDISGYTEETIPFKAKVKMIKYNGPIEYTTTFINSYTGQILYHKTIEQLIKDPYRINIILKYCKELSVNNHNIFVFADRRCYLENIKTQLLNNNYIAYIMDNDKIYEKVCTVMGGSSSTEMENAEKKAKIILTTFQFMGTGKSIPKMDALILATPRKTKSRQFCGRIFRLGSNYHVERQIIDIVDWKTIAKNQWYSRKKYYIEKKFPIEEITINYNIKK